MALKIGRMGHLVRPKPKFLDSWESNHLSKAALKRSLNFSIFITTSGTLILAHCVKIKHYLYLFATTLYYLALKNYTAAKLHSLRVTFIDDWSFAMWFFGIIFWVNLQWTELKYNKLWTTILNLNDSEKPLSNIWRPPEKTLPWILLELAHNIVLVHTILPLSH